MKRRSNKKDEDSNINSNTEATSRVGRKSNSNGDSTNVKPVFYDFMGRNHNHKTADLNLAPDSPHSGSSGVTELSSRECDDHEESSSCNSFPYFRRKS